MVNQLKPMDVQAMVLHNRLIHTVEDIHSKDIHSKDIRNNIAHNSHKRLLYEREIRVVAVGVNHVFTPCWPFSVAVVFVMLWTEQMVCCYMPQNIDFCLYMKSKQCK